MIKFGSESHGNQFDMKLERLHICYATRINDFVNINIDIELTVYLMVKFDISNYMSISVID